MRQGVPVDSVPAPQLPQGLLLLQSPLLGSTVGRGGSAFIRGHRRRLPLPGAHPEDRRGGEHDKGGAPLEQGPADFLCELRAHGGAGH